MVSSDSSSSAYPDPDPAIAQAAQAMLGDGIAVDLHSHLGRFYDADAFTGRCLDDMRNGQVGVSVAAAIGDKPVIARGERGLKAVRDPERGELKAATAAALERLAEEVRGNDAVLARSLADIDEARAAGRPAVIAAIEGGDCLEGDLNGISEAHDLGVRVFQLVHYRVNELGDIQTEAPVHGGLTEFGHAVVRDLEGRRMLVDLAHATFAVTRDVVEMALKPVILSHTVLGDAHPRCIDADHARLIAETGGVIGVWPSMLAVGSFGEFVDAIFRLVDVVGAEHVGIGTDMDAVRNPVYTGYRDFRVIPEALLARGMASDEVRMIVGDNFHRVFAAVAA